MKTIVLAIIASTVIVTFVIAGTLLFLLIKLFHELEQSDREYKEFKRELDKRSVELKKEFDEQKEKVNRWLK